MTFSFKLVGLTGGIASGKSAVAEIFRKHDIPVLDADSLGKMVLEPGQPAYSAVIETFGDEILGKDKRTIDRQKLGKAVFDNNRLREKLESITHPAISELAAKGLKLIESRGKKFAVYEAALLVETNIHRNMDFLIVVSTGVENQLNRLCTRDGLKKKDAATRIASQLPLSDKVKEADLVIQNNGTVEQLKTEAAKVAEFIKEKYS